ncbi:MAG TPA: hypothetical protein VGF30_00840 [Bacteroidia bacterium]
MKTLFIAFFLMTFMVGFSQENKGTALMHEMGLAIKMKDPNADASKYAEAALGYWYYDKFRFLDKRREINFEDGKAVLVLYSANEMFNDSQKLVSPLTIKDGASYQEYKLAIAKQGKSVKPMPLGTWLINN